MNNIELKEAIVSVLNGDGWQMLDEMTDAQVAKTHEFILRKIKEAVIDAKIGAYDVESFVREEDGVWRFYVRFKKDDVFKKGGDTRALNKLFRILFDDIHSKLKKLSFIKKDNFPKTATSNFKVEGNVYTLYIYYMYVEDEKQDNPGNDVNVGWVAQKMESIRKAVYDISKLGLYGDEREIGRVDPQFKKDLEALRKQADHFLNQHSKEKIKAYIEKWKGVHQGRGVGK